VPEVAAYLRQHNFKQLFTEELGWDHDSGEIVLLVRETSFQVKVIASKRGFRVLQTNADHFALFDRKWLRELQVQVFAHAYEHILIVSCDAPRKQVWMWATTSGSGKKRRHREHPFLSNSPSDGLVMRLEAMRFDLEEEERVHLLDAVERVKKALDTEPEFDLFVRRPWFARKSHALAAARKNGGVAAFQSFVEFHLPMLRWAADRFSLPMRGLDEEDRVQIVALGLLRASELFDETRGIQFSTYAYHWLRQAAQRNGPDCVRFVRVPLYLWRTRRRAIVALRELGFSHEPASAIHAMNELAERDLGLLTDWLRIEQTATIASLDDAEATGFREALPLEEPPQILFDWNTRNEANRIIFDVLENLLPRARMIIEMRFGLHGPKYTLKEIAHCLGLTRERVRQIEVETLLDLRSRLASDFGEEHEQQPRHI
jgi:RNA polymerase sigma factor (sigma-70 family)